MIEVRWVWTSTYDALRPEFFQPVSWISTLQGVSADCDISAKAGLICTELRHVALEATREFPDGAILVSLIRSSMESVSLVIHHIIRVALVG